MYIESIMSTILYTIHLFLWIFRTTHFFVLLIHKIHLFLNDLRCEKFQNLFLNFFNVPRSIGISRLNRHWDIA